MAANLLTAVDKYYAADTFLGQRSTEYFDRIMSTYAEHVDASHYSWVIVTSTPSYIDDVPDLPLKY